MRAKALGACISLIVAVVGVSCGGNPATPETAQVPSITGVETGDGVEAAGRLTKQRWIVEDACADGRGTRVRLFDFTGRGGQFPRHGYWLVANGGTLNRVIECERSHQICLGAVQDPPPGLQWGVGIRGDRFPCNFPNRCCFRCDTFAHRLTLSCQARTTKNLDELEGEILAEDEAPFE